MDIVRNMDRGVLAIDVCVIGDGRGAYEEELVSLGGRVLRCHLKRNPWRFAGRLERLLCAECYDVVHSHLFYFSGFILSAAARAGVPQRIAHLHEVLDLKSARLLRQWYTRWMRRWLCRHGTAFVSPTEASIEAIWGPDWRSDPNKRIIYNGIKVERFREPVDPRLVRCELGLPADARVVLNVARFAPHKRQEFLVDVAERVLERRRDVYFVLIGAGPLQCSVQETVHSRRLGEHFRFIGGLPNIDRYYSAADVFAFPSFSEGFGIVIIEAAAAGLRVIAQDIPGVREAATVSPAVILLPLETEAAQWAEVLSGELDKPRITEEERQRLLVHFPFTIEASVRSLAELYGLPGVTVVEGRSS